MRTKEEIEKMKDFIGFFNDGKFMNQEYRYGILNAFNYVLGYDTDLERMHDKLKVIFKEQEMVKKQKPIPAKSKVTLDKEDFDFIDYFMKERKLSEGKGIRSQMSMYINSYKIYKNDMVKKNG